MGRDRYLRFWGPARARYLNYRLRVALYAHYGRQSRALWAACQRFVERADARRAKEGA